MSWKSRQAGGAGASAVVLTGLPVGDEDLAARGPDTRTLPGKTPREPWEAWSAARRNLGQGWRVPRGGLI